MHITIELQKTKDMVGSQISHTSAWRLKSSSIKMDVENVAKPSPTIRTHHVERTYPYGKDITG